MYTEFLGILSSTLVKKRNKLILEWNEIGEELKKEKNEEYKDFITDGFVDRRFYIDEFENNVLSGILISLYSLTESHIKGILIRISKNGNGYIYPKKDKEIRLFSELEIALGSIVHPKLEELLKTISAEILMFNKVRNSLVHSNGFATEQIIEYARKKDSKFRVDKNGKILITSDYLQFTIELLIKFFKEMIYFKGEIIIGEY